MEPAIVATQLVSSKSTKGKEYQVKMYIFCPCRGFEERGVCTHLARAVMNSHEWQPEQDIVNWIAAHRV